MQKWQYEVIIVDFNETDKLDEKGKDGWEAISGVPYNVSLSHGAIASKMMVLLKRPIPEDSIVNYAADVGAAGIETLTGKASEIADKVRGGASGFLGGLAKKIGGDNG